MVSKSEGLFAVVTGAGSGIGQAAAIRLCSEGYAIALVGREQSKLMQTLHLLPEKDASFTCQADIAVEDDVARLVAAVLNKFGKIDLLVNAAGMNVPQRSIKDCSAADFARVVTVNLTGAFLLTKGFLPAMRDSGQGTVINIVSDSGLRGNNFAGAAYISSKFALKGFTESINAEERQNGIRATAIYPGEVNTPILDKRTSPPSAEQREKMLQAEDVAACIAMVAKLPARAIVEELVIRPAVQDWTSRR